MNLDKNLLFHSVAAGLLTTFVVLLCNLVSPSIKLRADVLAFLVFLVAAIVMAVIR